jgi:stearoyl-CoA desaturase (delta-9 desaturase)
MGWITSKQNFRTDVSQVRDLAKYPELVFLDRFDLVVPVSLAAALFGTGVWLEHAHPELGTTGGQMLVWGFFVSTVVLFHATCTINSLSHLLGNRRYETPDDSRNNWFLAILTLGEGWHNNHHHYQGSVRQGFRWWEYDVTYYLLRLFAAFRIVWDLHPVPEHLRSDGPGEDRARPAPPSGNAA